MDEKAGEVCPRVPVHPCQYSPEVIEVLRDAIEVDEAVHDPFAGTGTRLAALCDEIGATYTGTDIEDWAGRDPRVAQGPHKSAWQKKKRAERQAEKAREMDGQSGS